MRYIKGKTASRTRCSHVCMQAARSSLFVQTVGSEIAEFVHISNQDNIEFKYVYALWSPLEKFLPAPDATTPPSEPPTKNSFLYILFTRPPTLRSLLYPLPPITLAFETTLFCPHVCSQFKVCNLQLINRTSTP